MVAFSSKIIFTFIFCFTSVCVAHNKHGKAKGAGRHESATARMSLMGGIMNMIGHTTEAPSMAMETILRAASETISTVDSAHSVVDKILKTAKGAQSKTRDAAQRQIDGIVAKADALALKQGGERGCVTRLMGGSGALGLQVALNEADCPGDKVTQLEDMAQTVADSGQTGLTMGPDAVIKLDLCQRRGGLLVRLCEAKVAATFVKRASSVGLRASSVAAKASTLASTIEPSLEACAALKVAEASAKAAQLVGKMGLCSAGAAVGAVGGAVGGRRRKHDATTEISDYDYDWE